LTDKKDKSIFADTWALSLTIKESGMVHDCLRRLCLKLHQLTTRVELFYFALWIFVIPLGAHTISPGASYGERSKRV